MSEEQSKASNDNAGEGEQNITRALVWIGVAGLGAALAFTLIRSFTSRSPIDPTAQRVQQLIDEANRLLKTLDDKRTA